MQYNSTAAQTKKKKDHGDTVLTKPEHYKLKDPLQTQDI